MPSGSQLQMNVKMLFWTQAARSCPNFWHAPVDVLVWSPGCHESSGVSYSGEYPQRLEVFSLNIRTLGWLWMVGGLTQMDQLLQN